MGRSLHFANNCLSSAGSLEIFQCMVSSEFSYTVTENVLTVARQLHNPLKGTKFFIRPRLDSFVFVYAETVPTTEGTETEFICSLICYLGS